ncbi:MAG: CBS domain-containing protein [Zetaproteobacteria bacterium]|nr:CBS domain-containing protein [Zetaproteobacteria bacterium]
MSANPVNIIRVKDVMKLEFDMVESCETIRDALKKMQHVATKCLIVNKNNDDDEYGMVVLSDIARHVLTNNRSPDRVSIYEIMSKPAITVHPNMDIRHTSALFDRFGLSRAPVVNHEGQMVGIVSHTDMVMKGLLQMD